MDISDTCPVVKGGDSGGNHAPPLLPDTDDTLQGQPLPCSKQPTEKENSTAHSSNEHSTAHSSNEHSTAHSSNEHSTAHSSNEHLTTHNLNEHLTAHNLLNRTTNTNNTQTHLPAPSPTSTSTSISALPPLPPPPPTINVPANSTKILKEKMQPSSRGATQIKGLGGIQLTPRGPFSNTELMGQPQHPHTHPPHSLPPPSNNAHYVPLPGNAPPSSIHEGGMVARGAFTLTEHQPSSHRPVGGGNTGTPSHPPSHPPSVPPYLPPYPPPPSLPLNRSIPNLPHRRVAQPLATRPSDRNVAFNAGEVGGQPGVATHTSKPPQRGQASHDHASSRMHSGKGCNWENSKLNEGGFPGSSWQPHPPHGDAWQPERVLNPAHHGGQISGGGSQGLYSQDQRGPPQHSRYAHQNDSFTSYSYATSSTEYHSYNSKGPQSTVPYTPLPSYSSSSVSKEPATLQKPTHDHNTSVTPQPTSLMNMRVLSTHSTATSTVHNTTPLNSSNSLQHQQYRSSAEASQLPPAQIEIIEHPRSCAVDRNGCAELTCKARVNPPGELDYMWYKDGEPIVGEISDDCVVERVGEEEEGEYFCLVSDPSGEVCVETQHAEVKIRKGEASKAPKLTRQPEAYIEVVKGERLSLNISADGVPPFKYKWFKGTQELEYCTASVLSLPGVASVDSGQYSCTVTNKFGSVLSDIVQVRVVAKCTAAPAQSHGLTQQDLYTAHTDSLPPSDHLLLCLSRLVSQQYTNWARLSLFLGLPPSLAASSRLHQVSAEEQAFQLLREWRERQHGSMHALRIILGEVGIRVTESDVARVEGEIRREEEAGVVLEARKFFSPQFVHSIPSSAASALSISTHPQSVSVVYGQQALLQVSADSTDPHTTYQWYKNGRPLSARTDKQLLIASTVDSDEGSYSCQVRNSFGSVFSHTATIHVVSVAPNSQGTQRHSAPRRAGMGQYCSPAVGIVGGLKSRGVEDGVEGGSKGGEVGVKVQKTSEEKDAQLHITLHPRSQVVPLSSSVTLSCAATGPTDISFLWYMNGLSLPEEIQPHYHIGSMAEDDEGVYSCEVFSASGSVMSRMAKLSLKAV